MTHDAVMKALQAERLFVGHEMHSVTALRECNTQFRGQNAAASGGGVTRDADSHTTPSRPGGTAKITGSVAYKGSANSTPARDPQ